MSGDTVAKCHSSPFITGENRGFDSLGCASGVAGTKWRIRIVLDTQLDCLSHRPAGNLGHHTKAKVDPRRYAARRDHITIFNDAGLFMSGADQGQ
jgi:hypothetical protein